MNKYIDYLINKHPTILGIVLALPYVFAEWFIIRVLFKLLI